jgi:hypothetical protein
VEAYPSTLEAQPGSHLGPVRGPPVTIKSDKKKNFHVILKGQCHEIFDFWFFSWISFPPAPDYPIRTVFNFFENSLRYWQVKKDEKKGKPLCLKKQHKKLFLILEKLKTITQIFRGWIRLKKTKA